MFNTLQKPAFAAVIMALAVSSPSFAEGNLIEFEAGGGIAVAPEYDGSKNYKARPAFLGRVTALRLGSFGFGGPRDLGLYISPSFRFLNERNASDDASLNGFSDVDASFELGATVGYEFENARVFASARYGVVGHEGWVGELGADAIFRDGGLKVSIGPRVSFADETYFDTYFAVPNTAVNLAAYDPGSGVRAAGVEASLRYDFTEQWSFKGTARWERLVGDAADSPIVKAGSEDQFTAKLGFVRKFSFDF